MKKSFFSLAVFGCLSAPSLAIINGSDATLFDFVGQINGASGVVVAPNWVLTARHVGSGTFTVNGFSQTPDQVFNTDGTGGAPNSDLTLLHFALPFATWSTPYYGNSV